MEANKAKKKRRLKRDLVGLSMIALPTIGLITFAFLPILISAFLSFTELKTYSFWDFKWIGFDNFIVIFKDELFWLSLKNTFIYCVGVLIALVLGLITAVMLSSPKLKAKKFLRMVFFIPYVCSGVAVAIMWQWIYAPDFGILNTFVKMLGMAPVNWLKEVPFFRLAVIVMEVWSGTGFYVILYQAAIQKVDKSYYESADIDGATGLQKFFRITLPLISPTSFYLLVVGIIGGLQMFAQIQVLTGGNCGPEWAGLTVVYYIYIMAFEQVTTYGMGIASAMSWVIMLIIMGLTVINFKISNKWVYSD